MILKYKGYCGKINFDNEANLFHGEVIGLKDIITFQGKDIHQLEQVFKDSIEDYLAWCQERGEQPNEKIIMANNKQVYKIYEKIADWFDMHRSRELFEKPYLDEVITHLKPNAHILDVGCGTGEPIGQYFVDAGFQVTGIDASTKMLEIAKARCPKITFILSDMRHLNLNKKFDCIVAWHSFFHLPQDDQRAMFKTFTKHLNPHGILLITTGHEAGEVWGDNGGENLYHASLSPDEYKGHLKQHGFTLLNHNISDPECGDATVWLAKLASTS